jgi:2-dehydropantoate 2-reductase
MKIAVLGGGGAMGGMFGGYLARAGEDVVLIDVSRDAVEAINAQGLAVEAKDGSVATIPIKASSNPGEVGPVDLIINFVKCYSTDAAIRAAAPMLGEGAAILTLQNGWGNADRIAAIAGRGRVTVGLTYNSGTLLAPGRIKHSGIGMTVVGELDGSVSPRLEAAVAAFRRAGIETTASPRIVDEIWKKLALNVCTLPTAALLRFPAHELIQHSEMLDLMRGLLSEVAAVARPQGIALDEAERWAAIVALLEKAVGARASMLQDVEAGRRTEIDVVNGAIMEAGRRYSVPTPLNDAMVWLVKSLQAKYLAAGNSGWERSIAPSSA